jgi:5-methyltetrahydrofolate--homocysteine methyltransferase
MDTLLTSINKTVTIGPDQPFVIIGERINPTGRKRLAAEMAGWNFERVITDAIAQVQAGAHMLDVNAGIPLADEPAILAEAIRIVQSVVDVPLSIDSSVVKALEAGLAAYRGKPLVNSVTGEDERLDTVLPLVAKYGAAVIGISNDETGISEDPNERFKIAKKIVERAESYGIPRQDVLIDPLAMPVGAVRMAGAALFTLVRRLREELGVNTVCGASNISFGLPDRATLNDTFVAMAIAAGMTCAITNPLDESIRKSILAADVMMGHDENCTAWLNAHREDMPVEEGARQRRKSRREELAGRARE